MKLIISILLFSQLSFGYQTHVTYNETYSSGVGNTEMTLSIVGIAIGGALIWAMLKGMGNQAQWHLKEKKRLEKKIKQIKELQRKKRLEKISKPVYRLETA